MTEGELVKLLDVARRRPLLDAATVRRGKDAGKAVANLRPETVERLELLGRERALIYKTLVLTGLRKGELATLAAGQLDLDAEPPFLKLDTDDEKNREGNSIPLRSDLAAICDNGLQARRRHARTPQLSRSTATPPTRPNALPATLNAFPPIRWFSMSRPA
jgi:integrase